MPRQPKPPQPGPHSHLKPQIRQTYETTDISLRALAASFGISSDNTIRRWIAAENWQRNHAAIRARLVTRAVALGTDPLAPLVPQMTIDGEHAPPDPNPRGLLAPPLAFDTTDDTAHQDHQGSHHAAPAPGHGLTREQIITTWPWGYGVMQPPEAFGTIAADAPAAPRPKSRRSILAEKTVPPVPEHSGSARPDRKDSKPDPSGAGDDSSAHGEHTPDVDAHMARTRSLRSTPTTHSTVAKAAELREAEDRLDLSATATMAEIEARAIRKQIGVSDRLMELGAHMTAQVMLAMSPLGPDASDEDQAAQLQSIMRLKAVNADKETLAGLLKASAQVLQVAVTMQRKALGMDTDPESTKRGQIGGSGFRQTEEKTSALAHMPLDLLRQMRSYALERSRIRPRTSACGLEPKALDAATEVREKFEAEQEREPGAG
jgi:hypothetical protein